MKKIKWLACMLLTGCSLTAVADNVYTIYPIPQQQTAVDGTAKITAGKVQVICGSDIDKPTQDRIRTILEEQGLVAAGSESTLFVQSPADGYTHIYIGVNGKDDAADRKATALGLERTVFGLAAKYDKHIVSITSGTAGHAEITVLGENTDAAFCGLASIEQILDTYGKADFTIPCGTLYDYADQQNRGLVEGYYGVPYPVDVKKDLMRFMMRHKMNSYMYGAKSDPYHSAQWKDAYPQTISQQQRELGYLTQNMVKELTEVSYQTKVNFIWAIHPGNAFLGSSTVVNDIMSKFKKMYNLGIRQFAIFVDDVSIPTTDADFQLNADRVTAVQRSIEAEWNKEGALPADTVKPLQFVPQIYCSSFAGGGEPQRKAFFTALSTTPANVAVYTTGWGVWSVPNSGDVEQVRQYLGRDVAWWWNYPCNDNDANKLFPMDMYTNFSDESHISSSAKVDAALANCLGVLSNPMQQGEVSKIALFGVADYAWNNDAFNNQANWKASFPAIVGEERADALKTLCPYLRYYDSDALSSLVNTYKTGLKAGNPNGKKLMSEMESIISAATEMQKLKDSDSESDRLLYTDLAPWLNKLKSMAEQTRLLLAAAEADTDVEKWNNYAPTPRKVAALDTDEAFFAPQLAGSVGANLSVSATKAMPAHVVLYPFISYLQENVLGDLLGSGKATKARIFSNLETTRGSVTTQKGMTTFIGSLNKLQKGEYVGMALPQPIRLKDIFVADTLAANWGVFTSGNGREWTAYDKQAALETHIRYLCVTNLGEEPRAVSLNNKTMGVYLPEETELNTAATTIPDYEPWDGHTKVYMTDGDYSTFTCINRNQASGDAYTVKLAEAEKIGDVRICMGTVNGDYMTAGRVQVSAGGNTWRTLKIKGTNSIDYRMNIKQVVKYSDEMSYCDFDGDNEEALYVRLLLSTPNTNKWLRLYEIEVNKQSYKACFKSPCADASGNAIATLDDGKGFTGLDDEKQYVTYHFYDLRKLQSVKIFQDMSGRDAASPVAVKVGTDKELTQWTDAGTLTEPLQVVDLNGFTACYALKLEWEGTQTPAVYEIIEVLDESSYPEITAIERVTTAQLDAFNVENNGRTLLLTSGKGIRSVRLYDAQGRCLVTQKQAGQSTASIAVPAQATGTCIVTAQLANGETASYKLILR